MGHLLTIEYGDELLSGLGMSPKQFGEEARFLLAVKLFELGRITSGQAALLCGMSRVEFLVSLPKVGVPASNLHPEDADVELEFGRHG